MWPFDQCCEFFARCRRKGEAKSEEPVTRSSKQGHSEEKLEAASSEETTYPNDETKYVALSNGRPSSRAHFLVDITPASSMSNLHSDIGSAWDLVTRAHSCCTRTVARLLLGSFCLLVEVGSLIATIALVQNDDDELSNSPFYALTILATGMAFQVLTEISNKKRIQDFQHMLFQVLLTPDIAMQALIIDAVIPKSHDNNWSLPVARRTLWLSGSFFTGALAIKTIQEIISYCQRRHLHTPLQRVRTQYSVASIQDEAEANAYQRIKTLCKVLFELLKITIGSLSWYFGHSRVNAQDNFFYGLFLPELLMCFGIGLICDVIGKGLEAKFKYNHVVNLLMRKYSFTLLILPLTTAGTIYPLGMSLFILVMIIRGYIKYNKQRIGRHELRHLEKNIEDFMTLVKDHPHFFEQVEQLLQEKNSAAQNDKIKKALTIALHIIFLFLPIETYFVSGQVAAFHQLGGGLLALATFHFGNWIERNPCETYSLKSGQKKLSLSRNIKDKIIFELNNFYFRDSSQINLLYGIILRFWENTTIGNQAILGAPLYWLFCILLGAETVNLRFSRNSPFLFFQKRLPYLTEEKVTQLQAELAASHIKSFTYDDLKLACQIKSHVKKEIGEAGWAGLLRQVTRSYIIIPKPEERVVNASDQATYLASTAFQKNFSDALAHIKPRF